MRCAGLPIAANRSANEIHQGEITPSIRLGLNTSVIELGDSQASKNFHNHTPMDPRPGRVLRVVRMYA